MTNQRPGLGPDQGRTGSPWRRFCLWLVLFIAVCAWQGPGFVENLRPPGDVPLDFYQDWASARNFFEGLPIYTNHDVTIERYLGRACHGTERTDVDAHPPTSVLMVLPFAGLKYTDAFLAWAVLSLAALGISGWLMVRTLKVPVAAWPLLPLAGTLLLLCGPFRHHMNQGQLNLILLALLTGAWAAARSERCLWAGSLLGTATAIKLFPGFLFFYFFLRRQWRVVAAGMAALIGWTVLSVAVLGFETYVVYSRDVLPHVAYFRTHWLNSSLAGFWSRLFDVGYGRVQPIRHWPALAWATIVISDVVVMGLLAKLVLGMGRPFSVQCAAIPKAMSWVDAGSAPPRNVLFSDGAFAVFIIAMLLVSPIAWDHYFVLLFLPLVILWIALDSCKQKRVALSIIMVLLWLAPPMFWYVLCGLTRQDLTTRQATPAQSLTGLSVPFYALLSLFVFALAECRRLGKEGASGIFAGPHTTGSAKIPERLAHSNGFQSPTDSPR